MSQGSLQARQDVRASNPGVVPAVRRSGFLRDSALSLADQSLLSIANFLVGVLLIQSISKESYGAYVFAYAVLLYIIGVQNALVTTPMTVLAPQKASAERSGFCDALAVGQYLVFAPLAILAVALAGLAMAAGWLSIVDGRLALCVAVVSLAVLLREFARCLLFLRLDPASVLGMDFVYVAILVGTLWWVRGSETAELQLLAMMILGVASILSVVVVLTLRLLSLPRRGMAPFDALKETWPLGRWALAGVTVTWFQDQSYVYLVALLAGAASAADANAARLLLMPIMLLNVGVNRITMPRWANLRAAGQSTAIEYMAYRVLGVLLVLAAAYVITLWLVRDIALVSVFSEEYRSIGGLILLWGLVIGLQIARSNYSIMLQVYECFRQITIANLVSAVLVIALGFVLIPDLGAAGGLIALLFGELILVVLLAVSWRQLASASA